MCLLIYIALFNYGYKIIETGAQLIKSHAQWKGVHHRMVPATYTNQYFFCSECREEYGEFNFKFI